MKINIINKVKRTAFSMQLTSRCILTYSTGCTLNIVFFLNMYYAPRMYNFPISETFTLDFLKSLKSSIPGLFEDSGESVFFVIS